MNDDIYQIPIQALELGDWLTRKIRRTGIQNVGELLELLDHGADTFLAIRHTTVDHLEHIMSQLHSKGYLPKNT